MNNVKLIVGLGNPGNSYSFNRHNIGFMVVDAFVRYLDVLSSKLQEHNAILWKIKFQNDLIFIAKPQLYMNRSGESLRSLKEYYKIELQNILVVHDDIDQQFFNMKFHQNRGHGGHNGVKSINAQLGSINYTRLKLGVGRPVDSRFKVADYVLQDFNRQEQSKLPILLETCIEAIEIWIEKGAIEASNQFNKKEHS